MRSRLSLTLLAASALFAVPASAQLSSLSNPSTGNGSAVWGNITGTLSSQTDLTTVLATKPTLSGGVLAGTNFPALTGDVTTSAGSLTTVIPAGTVTLAKQANLAANSIQGNNTGSPATPLALTAAQTKTLLAISSADVSGLAATATSTAASNLTGTLNAAQFPALTGDATTSAGSVATSVVSATGNGTDFVVASPNRIKVSGNATTPSPASTDAYFLHNTAGGAVVAGNGSSFDFQLVGSGGGALLYVAHGSSTVQANNAFQAGGSILSSTGAGGVGYTTGAGGTITQITTRATGVTLNKVCGAITLVSAAGSATWASFTVTDSSVAATDVIIVNQKSGTDKYMLSVTNVAAGSFVISSATTGGTTTEQPVFQFCVIKGVNA